MVPAAQAAIIFTNVNGGSGLALSSINQNIYFSVTSGTYRLGSIDVPGDQFCLTFAFDDYQKPAIQGFSGNKIYYDAGFVDKLNAGASISGSMFFYDSGFMANHGSGPWVGGGNGYLGLKIGSNYGWANVSLVANTTLALYGFAYDNTGAPILAGAGQPVPEPAATALLGALVAGSAVAFAARRKRKLAKAA